MNILPKEIINHILTFVDNKSFYNCLKSSKIFNIQDYNLVCQKDYIDRKYKNTSIEYFILKEDLKEIIFLNQTGIKCTENDLFIATNKGNLEIVKYIISKIDISKESIKLISNNVSYFHEPEEFCKICKVCDWLDIMCTYNKEQQLEIMI